MIAAFRTGTSPAPENRLRCHVGLWQPSRQVHAINKVQLGTLHPIGISEIVHGRKIVGRAMSLVFAALAVAACETAKETNARPPAMQKIALDTPGVAGAQCSLNAVTVGNLNVTTPASVEVDRSPEIIVVRCRKACYLDASAMISAEGQRLKDGSVLYSYPSETRIDMKSAASCDPAAARPKASPL